LHITCAEIQRSRDKSSSISFIDFFRTTLQVAHTHLPEHQVADASVFAPLMTTGEYLSFELFKGSLKINEGRNYYFSNPAEMSQFLMIQ
jgi:hypothetical protein